MWLTVECKRAYMVPYHNSSICYCHHFEHLFLLGQINFNVYILIFCLLLHKRFIFIHCLASFTLMWVRKCLGAAYAADRVWKGEFYLFHFFVFLTAFYSF